MLITVDMKNDYDLVVVISPPSSFRLRVVDIVELMANSQLQRFIIKRHPEGDHAGLISIIESTYRYYKVNNLRSITVKTT